MGVSNTVTRMRCAPKGENLAFLLWLLVLPDLPEEDRLLMLAREGDGEAISALYEAFFEPVYQFIRWRVSDAAQAEDLTSEVFVKFLSAMQSPFAPRQSVRGWLFRVARNVLYDHRQTSAPLDDLDEDFPAGASHDAEAQMLHRLDTDRLHQAIGRLAPDQQEVVLLRFGQMMSLQDTAESMGRSVSAIKSLQFRAIDTLRRVLAESTPESGHYGAG
jgi:RNA polymerase sigma-70 factor, ECF subfamily